MTQTYCTRADVESLLSQEGLLAAIDDNADGVESAEETQYITDAIERAASEMNACLSNQYDPLSALADNAWCKWCNAHLAAHYLRTRRGNPSEMSVEDNILRYRELLERAAWGRFSVPEQAPTHDHTASLSNLKPEIFKANQPIRVDLEESTGDTPHSSRLRYPTDTPGYGF